MVLFGENVPVPEVDHIPPLATVTAPFRLTVALLAQTVTLLPASAVGAWLNVMVMLLDTGAQAPLFLEVRVRVTLPAVVSALLGI